MTGLTFGSLFSGFGGMDLGLERAGLRCVFQVEIEPYAQKVLTKHWPSVPLVSDVRAAHAWDFCPTRGANPIAHNCRGCLQHPDVLAGGFPCQDISNAGKRAGLAGERSGLWAEFHRLVCELQPRYVLVENVSALLARGLGRVLGDLAASGFDAEWDCLPASALGAPHRRDRLFLVAYAHGLHRQRQPESVPGSSIPAFPGADGTQGEVANPQGVGRGKRGARRLAANGEGQPFPHRTLHPLAHTDRQSLAVGTCLGGDARAQLEAFVRSCSTGAGVWATEPDVGRVVDGVPRRVERLRGLGNAALPQIVEWLGRRIIQHAQDAT